ncbi:MAG: hypothetical protein QY330_02650 [Candidatus Dojkabacteria bacterium]|uniref:DUF4190 domain-containing protein n=2 Tax=Candidatus Dojkabacteria TaxID=74243 RepID=A0A136KJW6_9BACT|nr:MAG: hypothetical protein UZ20_WS6002000290 [candidate division WS6 bacterium OLB21]MBW7953778.1 hypothetical protein [Candidatus Dojkabacteria bacterium]WKZ28473.1 MAG: hypothetical protein QY330_02650 [Candidatus Dojkabacteria bacterium]
MSKRFFPVAFALMAFFVVVGLVNVVAAQSLLPAQIADIFNLTGPDGSGSAQFVTSRVQLALVIALGIVVLIAVVYAIMAAIKYIQSQGDSGKIEEAQKSITAIFMGIAAMLLAIVGIVLVFVFFGASRPDPNLFQTCLSAPNSVGCKACLADPADSVCTGCEAEYEAFAKGQGQISVNCK